MRLAVRPPRSRRVWEGKMTNRTTIALMAAALILAVSGQPRAQTAVESNCPCGDPADIVPIQDWRKRDVQCTVPIRLMQTPTRASICSS